MSWPRTHGSKVFYIAQCFNHGSNIAMLCLGHREPVVQIPYLYVAQFVHFLISTVTSPVTVQINYIIFFILINIIEKFRDASAKCAQRQTMGVGMPIKELGMPIKEFGKRRTSSAPYTLTLYADFLLNDSIGIFMRYPCLKIISVFHITLTSPTYYFRYVKAVFIHSMLCNSVQSKFKLIKIISNFDQNFVAVGLSVKIK